MRPNTHRIRDNLALTLATLCACSLQTDLAGVPHVPPPSDARVDDSGGFGGADGNENGDDTASPETDGHLDAEEVPWDMDTAKDTAWTDMDQPEDVNEELPAADVTTDVPTHSDDLQGTEVVHEPCDGVACPDLFGGCQVGSCNQNTDECEYEQQRDGSRCDWQGQSDGYCFRGACGQCSTPGHCPYRTCLIATCDNGACGFDAVANRESCWRNNDEQGICINGQCGECEDGEDCPDDTPNCYQRRCVECGRSPTECAWMEDLEQCMRYVCSSNRCHAVDSYRDPCHLGEDEAGVCDDGRCHECVVDDDCDQDESCQDNECE